MTATSSTARRGAARLVPSRHQLARLRRGGAIWLIVVALALFGQLLSPVFLTSTNLLNVISQSSVIGIAAVGVTFVMLSGEIDVSVAGTATLTAVMGAVVMDGSDQNIAAAVAIAIGIGAAVGVFNGLLVARGVQSFILTLAVGVVLLGIGKLITGGTPRGNVAPSFTELFVSRPASIPFPDIALLVVVLLAYAVQRGTRLGHRIRLVGANASMAHLSGVNVTGTVVGAYVLSGIAAGLAGLTLIGRTGVPNDFGGMGLEFQALAAVVIGGTAFAGGRGSVIGTLAGMLFLSMSLTLGIIIGLPYGAQLLEYGALIVIAGVIYSLLRRHEAGAG
jgi:ribose/xylose/arabinose/galactoside ABC-type transport system permease subunit